MNPNMSSGAAFSFVAPEGTPAFPVAEPRHISNPPPPHLENSLEYWRRRAEVLDPVVFELRSCIKSLKEQVTLAEAANAEVVEKYNELKASYAQLVEENKQRAQADEADAGEVEATIQKLTEEKVALEEKAKEWESTSERKRALEEGSDKWNEAKKMLTEEKLALEQKVADMAAFSKEEESKHIELQKRFDELGDQCDQQLATITLLEIEVEQKESKVVKLSTELKNKEEDIKDLERKSTKAKKDGDTALDSQKAQNSQLNQKIRELREVQDAAHTELEQLRSDMDRSHQEKKQLEAEKKGCEQALKDLKSRLIEQKNVEREYSELMRKLARTEEHAQSLEAELDDLNRENARRSPPMDSRGRAQISLDRELLSAESASTRSLSEERVDTDRTLSPSRLDSGVESTIRTSTKAPKPMTGFNSFRRKDNSRVFPMHKPHRTTRSRTHSDPGESSHLASNGSRGAPEEKPTKEKPTEEKPTGHTTSEFTVEQAPSIAISKSKTFSHNPFRCWLQVYIDLWTCFMGWLAFHNFSLIADTGPNGSRTKYLQINPAAPYHPEHTDLKPPSSKAASGENARAYRDQAPPNIELPPFWTNVFWLLTHIAFYAFCYICASSYSCTLRERASWQAANELTRQMFLRDYGYLHRHFGEQNWLDIICFNLSTWLDVGPSYSG